MTETVEEQEKRYDELVEKLADVVDWDVLMDKHRGIVGDIQLQILLDDVLRVMVGKGEKNDS